VYVPEGPLVRYRGLPSFLIHFNFGDVEKGDGEQFRVAKLLTVPFFNVPKIPEALAELSVEFAEAIPQT
jgi:hypothetical protein